MSAGICTPDTFRAILPLHIRRTYVPRVPRRISAGGSRTHPLGGNRLLLIAMLTFRHRKSRTLYRCVNRKTPRFHETKVIFASWRLPHPVTTNNYLLISTCIHRSPKTTHTRRKATARHLCYSCHFPAFRQNLMTTTVAFDTCKSPTIIGLACGNLSDGRNLLLRFPQTHWNPFSASPDNLHRFSTRKSVRGKLEDTKSSLQET